MTIQTLTIAAAIGLSGLAFSVQNGTPDNGIPPAPQPGSEIFAPETPAPPQVLARGKEMYHISCVPCHGADGKGDGPIAANLPIKPRDFTRGIYMNRSTASGELPTDYDILRTITRGLHDTPMPSFQQMRPEDRWAIVQYVKTFSPRFTDSTEYPLDVINVGNEILPSPQSIARGRQVFLQMQCMNCHGIDGEGNGPASKTLSDDFGNQILPTNLTNASDYKFARNVLDVFRIFSTGLNGTPMPSYAQSVNDTDRWNLANYVWALQDDDQYIDSGADSILTEK
ncbi:MAG TPA: c-type cytochrome [Candidatus Kapabacteria bacterium]|nr:c-type cytochrome [Candidatus Kapabacteria bacterium]